jgi:hypothetical protein
MAKYTWQGHKTNEDIQSELKTNPAVNKTKEYRNKWIQCVRQMDRDRLPHLITKYQPSRK